MNARRFRPENPESGRAETTSGIFGLSRLTFGKTSLRPNQNRKVQVLCKAALLDRAEQIRKRGSAPFIAKKEEDQQKRLRKVRK